MLQELQTACSNMDLQGIRHILMRAVDGFEPDTLADDPLWLSKPVAVQAATVPVRPAAANVTPLHKR
jgi:hypothetical protein